MNFSEVLSLHKTTNILGNNKLITFYDIHTLSDYDYYLIKYGSIISDDNNDIALKFGRHTTYHNYYFYKKDRKDYISKIILKKLAKGFEKRKEYDSFGYNLTEFTDDSYHTNIQIKKINILFNIILSKNSWLDEDIKNMNSISKIKFVLCVNNKKLNLNQMLFLNSIYKSEKVD